eukprot:4854483-Pyramimonas_sp.AAC.1
MFGRHQVMHPHFGISKAYRLSVFIIAEYCARVLTIRWQGFACYLTVRVRYPRRRRDLGGASP